MDDLRQCQKLFTLSHRAIQKYNKQCLEILHELKKILKKNILIKNRLKFILKKYDFFKDVSKFMLQYQYKNNVSSKIGKSCKSLNHDYCLERNHFKFSKNKFFKQANENTNKYCNNQIQVSNDETEEIHSIYNSNNENILFFVDNLTQMPDINSRTPSPSHLKWKTNAAYSNVYNTKDVSLIDHVKNMLHKSPKCSNNDLKNCRSNAKKICTVSDTSPKDYALVEKIILSPETQSLTPSPGSNLKNIMGIEKSYTNKYCLPTYFKEKNISRIINKGASNFEKKKLFTDSLFTSTSQIISIDKLKNTEQCTTHFLNNISCDCNIRGRSKSFSHTPRSLSKSPSGNTNEILKRSCSKSSICISSPTQSQNSYSHSSRSISTNSYSTSRLISTNSSPSRSPSIPRRYGSPSFLDRRRITSARKRPVPYHRPTPSPISSPSSKQSSEQRSESSISDRSHKSSLNYSED